MTHESGCSCGRWHAANEGREQHVCTLYYSAADARCVRGSERAVTRTRWQVCRGATAARRAHGRAHAHAKHVKSSNTVTLFQLRRLGRRTHTATFQGYFQGWFQGDSLETRFSLVSRYLETSSLEVWRFQGLKSRLETFKKRSACFRDCCGIGGDVTRSHILLLNMEAARQRTAQYCRQADNVHGCCRSAEARMYRERQAQLTRFHVRRSSHALMCGAGAQHTQSIQLSPHSVAKLPFRLPLAGDSTWCITSQRSMNQWSLS